MKVTIEIKTLEDAIRAGMHDFKELGTFTQERHILFYVSAFFWREMDRMKKEGRVIDSESMIDLLSHITSGNSDGLMSYLQGMIK